MHFGLFLFETLRDRSERNLRKILVTNDMCSKVSLNIYGIFGIDIRINSMKDAIPYCVYALRRNTTQKLPIELIDTVMEQHMVGLTDWRQHLRHELKTKFNLTLNVWISHQ